MSTHLGNGAHPTLPKNPELHLGINWPTDRLIASFIVDGIHIPAAFLQGRLRAKGARAAVLVTDAVMPAMCEPGVQSGPG